ncbi:MAG: hypothetical protein EOO28_20760 [Comamonadaceae bacterium]|nr:MAG: hypothetical protein EOO28_20760 [Comamonadaceae bacterium]
MIDNEYQIQRALCTATASWLRACAVIAAWSLGLSVVAIALLTLGARSLAVPTLAGLGVVATAGLLERYFALRIRLDAGLFQGLADGAISSVGVLDASLEQLGLRKTNGTAGVQRSLDDRIRGARRLARRHALLVAAQSAVFVGVLLMLR